MSVKLHSMHNFILDSVKLHRGLIFFSKFPLHHRLFPAVHCKWYILYIASSALQWHHNGRDSVSNRQPHDCFLNHLLRHWSKKTSKLRVTGLFAGNSPEASEFPAQMASNTENVSIWWRHHEGFDTLSVSIAGFPFCHTALLIIQLSKSSTFGKHWVTKLVIHSPMESFSQNQPSRYNLRTMIHVRHLGELLNNIVELCQTKNKS